MNYTAIATTNEIGNRLVAGFNLNDLRPSENLGSVSPVDGSVKYETKVYTVSELIGGVNGVSRPKPLDEDASVNERFDWRQKDAKYRAHIRYNLLLTRMIHEGVVDLSSEIRVGRSVGRLSAVTVLGNGAEYRMFGKTYYGRHRVTEDA